MWTCSTCGRIFKRKGQQHSCKKVSLEKHFENKELVKTLFDTLVERIIKKVGECKVVSIPCCIHLFGKYDFLAALPKKDRLEVRFALDRELKGSRVKTTVPISSKVYKNVLDISSLEEIDAELIGWLKKSYEFRN